MPIRFGWVGVRRIICALSSVLFLVKRQGCARDEQPAMRCILDYYYIGIYGKRTPHMMKFYQQISNRFSDCMHTYFCIIRHTNCITNAIGNAECCVLTYIV